MKFVLKIAGFFAILVVLLFDLSSCKKDKLITDSGAKIQFSQDSVLFDTVFTTIGSSTKNIRIRNKNSQRIKISSIQLQGGSASSFIINVDGVKGTSFTDVEIAAHDSMYIFIQVNVNPTNTNSPLIITDALNFSVNGNNQVLHLEAWGQDAYYHRPTDAITFSDGSYLAYSTISTQTNVTVTWNNDKPHVIYGYLVVDSTQKLIINAGVRVYLNNKAGLWVFRYGELQVHGLKGNEVTFTGARRDADFVNEPGQWDRIWINEGSVNNEIDYAIIKNGYIGVQAELIGNNFSDPRRLKITNTKIQNMSYWGFYGSAFNVYGANNVFSDCQEYSANLTLGGKYTFLNCTFSNFWNQSDKARDKPTLNINNHSDLQVLPLDSAYFGNCIIDGTFTNEINLDLDYSNTTAQPVFIFSSSWLRTTNTVSDTNKYKSVRTGSSLNYHNTGTYDFSLPTSETQVQGFTSGRAQTDAAKFPFDINNHARNTNSVTAGAYEVN